MGDLFDHGRNGTRSQGRDPATSVVFDDPRAGRTSLRVLVARLVCCVVSAYENGNGCSIWQALWALSSALSAALFHRRIRANLPRAQARRLKTHTLQLNHSSIR